MSAPAMRTARETLRSRGSLHFSLLWQAVDRFASQDPSGARQILENYPSLEVDRDPDDLKAFLFLKALWRRLDEDLQHAGNLYLRSFASRQIDLFNLMATRMPLISRTSLAANDFLLSLIGLQDEPVVLDVGIGTGRQMVALLQELAGIRQKPSRLRLIGIEPSKESLQVAHGALTAATEQAGVPLDLHLIQGCVESLSEEEWERVRRLGAGAVINEAFALHHVTGKTGGVDNKDRVLSRLAELRPSGFVLLEPHSNHETADLRVRFGQAWHHYGLVFEVIDRMGLEPSLRDAMKVQFFAREIEDVVGMPENVRTERHELAEMWLSRLSNAGFSPLDARFICPAESGNGISSRWRGDYLSFEVDGHPVVALMAMMI